MLPSPPGRRPTPWMDQGPLESKGYTAALLQICCAYIQVLMLHSVEMASPPG